MNKKSNLKLALLSSITATTLATVAFGSTFLASKSDFSQSTINQNLTRAATNISNPSTLFYISSDLPKTTADIFNETNGTVNQTNVEKWKNFSNNVKKYKPSSQLATYGEKVEKIANLNRSIYEIKQSKDPLIQQAFEPIKQSLIQTSGLNSEKLEEAIQVDDLTSLLLEISGIQESSDIREISIPSTFEKKDLTLPETSPGTSLGISSVAEPSYKQLIKIAEIDPNQTGNYVFKFSYSSSTTSQVKGYLIIKNNQNQLAADNISDLTKSLDIFGRYYLKPSDIISKDSIYKESLENFIIQKVNGTVEVLVRLKDGEKLNNLRMANLSDDIFVRATSDANLKDPAKFGILDVQADDNNTFRNLISSTPGTKLANLTDSNVIKNIQFFSTYFKSTPSSGENLWKNDRILSFYQGDKTEIALKMYHAVKENSDVAKKTFWYKPITTYQSGSSISTQRTLNIKVEAAASNIDGTYDLHSEFRSALPDEVREDNFKEASTIVLKSNYDTNSKIALQKLTFSDYFYALGENQREWASTNRNIDANLVILDPTQKIFGEKPLSYSESAQSTDSAISAIESADARDKIIGFLGEIYQDFAKSNSGGYTNNNPLGTVLSYEDLLNIKTIDVDGVGNNIYQALNNTWKNVSEAMNTIFGASTNKNKFDVSSTGSGKVVIENSLIKITEFTKNQGQIEKIVADSINLVEQNVPNNTITEALTLGELSSEVKQQLANNLVSLIRLQFSTIDYEFVSRQYEPIYNSLKEAISSTETVSYSVINNPSDVLELIDVDGIKLFKYKDQAWDKVATEKDVTFKEALKSLIDLLYFANNDDLTSDQTILLGSSIFNQNATLKNNIYSSFKSLSNQTMLEFDNDSIDSKNNKVLVLNSILTSLSGNPKWSFQDKINDALKNKTKLTLDSNDLKSWFKTVLANTASTSNNRGAKVEAKNINSYYLDDLISGTNAIICLKWKLNQLSGASLSTTQSLTKLVPFRGSNLKSVLYKNSDKSQELVEKINSILNGSPQFSANELSIWSSIVNSKDEDKYNYGELYSNSLSGRQGLDEFKSKVNALINDDNILASRILPTSTDALLALEKILSLLWWIIIALVAAGVLVASGYSISSKDRRVKLSSRPVLKWLLVSGIVFGLVAIAVAILFGIVL